MMAPISHEEATGLLEAAALDALDAAEQQRVVAHAESCDECGPMLAALRESIAMLAYAAPAAPVDVSRRAALRGRLLARAAAGHVEGRAAQPMMGSVADPMVPNAGAPASSMPTILPLPMARGPRATPTRAATPARGVPAVDFNDAVNAGRWMRSHVFALAASLAFVASTGVLAFVLHSRTELQASYNSLSKWSSALEGRLDSASKSLAASTRLVEALSGRQVKVVELAAVGPNTPTARMFWNQATNRWTMFAHNLLPPAPGRTYQLWLVVSNGTKISAGTFAPTTRGEAMVAADYALPANALEAIAVTDEPIGGVAQPTGQMVLLGKE